MRVAAHQVRDHRGVHDPKPLDAVEPKDLNQAIYDDVIHKTGADAKEVFHAVYKKLIGRDQGPRLPGFLKEIGKDRLLALL